MSAVTTDKTFKEDISASVPVMVDFWAPWCGPCKMISPIIERISEKMTNRAKVYKLNVDENPAIANQYGITGIPTVIVFKNGEIERQFVGVQTEQVYTKALEELTEK